MLPLFIVNSWHYYSNFTVTGYAFVHEWKIIDSLVYFKTQHDTKWWLDGVEVQKAYQQYLLRLITSTENCL